MKIKNGKLNIILAVCSFKSKLFTDGRIPKQKYILCVHSGMQQFLVNYWGKYDLVGNWINICTFFAVDHIHEL